MDSPRASKSWTGRLLALGRFALAAVLLLTALAKLLDNRGFAAVIGTYGLLPNALLLPAGLAIGLAELGLSLWLFSGRRLSAAGLASAAMHFGYFLLLASALWRGLVLANCGCFGAFWARPLSIASLGEDLVLIAVSLAVWHGARIRRTG